MAEQYDWEKGLLLNAPVFPKSTVEYQSFLDSGDFSALEDVLMEHLEMAPEDIAWYFPAYRTFIRKHDESRVSAFLSLHIDTLKECHDLSSEIILLQAIQRFFPARVTGQQPSDVPGAVGQRGPARLLVEAVRSGAQHTHAPHREAPNEAAAEQEHQREHRHGNEVGGIPGHLEVAEPIEHVEHVHGLNVQRSPAIRKLEGHEEHRGEDHRRIQLPHAQ